MGSGSSSVPSPIQSLGKVSNIWSFRLKIECEALKIILNKNRIGSESSHQVPSYHKINFIEKKKFGSPTQRAIKYAPKNDFFYGWRESLL